MNELKQDTIKFFLELGFSQENAAKITEELYYYALEDTYALLLSKEDLNQLNIYLEQKDTDAILKLNAKIDNTQFMKTLSEKLSEQLLRFVKQMIDQLPKSLHQEMENRLTAIEAKLTKVDETSKS
jgi:hypothetical protein